MSDIVAALARLHRSDPHRPLIHLPASGIVLDAEDVWQAMQRDAEALRAAGLQPRQVIVVAAGNRAGVVALTVACRALDLVLVPVDTGTTVPEVTGLADRLDASALAIPGVTAAAHRLPSTPLGDGLVLVLRRAGAVRSVHDAAVMKLTSGSTGTPKTTLTTEAQLIADARQVITGMRIGPDDTQLAVISLAHSYGLSVLLLPLLLQGTAIVLRESFVPANLAADVRAAGARVFPGVPFMFQHFLAHPPADGWPSGLNKLISAGARLPLETVRDFATTFAVKIHSFYGTSESGGITYDDSEDVDASETLGRPLPGVTITFIADDGTPPGTGRIFVQSSAVSTGYAGEVNDAFRDGGFLTGDYGAFDTRGRLALKGRVSSFINVAGKKVDPAEVEQVLALMPGVHEAYVTAAADAQRGEQVVACLAVTAGLTTFAVRQYCSTRLSPHKIPRTIVFVDAIPRTARGKVDRRALDALVASNSAEPA